MTKLLPQQEKAAQLYVELGYMTEAFKQAGYGGKSNPKTMNEKASKFFAQSKIQARVDVIRAELQQRHNVTLDSLTIEYNEAKQRAIGLEQTTAEISAINGKAKIHGFDKTTIEVKLPRVVRRNLAGKDSE